VRFAKSESVRIAPLESVRAALRCSDLEPMRLTQHAPDGGSVGLELAEEGCEVFAQLVPEAVLV
jgi:hypothetical protein